MHESLDKNNTVLRKALNEHVLPLRRYALSLSGNLHDADDLLQTTLEKALTTQTPTGPELLPWLFRVCRNAWIDETRYRKVRQAPDAMDVPEPAFDGEAQVQDQMALEEVERTLAKLPEDQREVLELVAVEGLSYQQASEVLDVPKGTVMSRLARARARLNALRHGAQTGTAQGHDA